MEPIRNPNWSTSGMRVTLSYLPHYIPGISIFAHSIYSLGTGVRIEYKQSAVCDISKSGITSTSYDAPSIVTTMHRHEQTIYLQLINKHKNSQKRKKKNNVFTYTFFGYRMENCLDVVGLDL